LVWFIFTRGIIAITNIQKNSFIFDLT
jgi:hypothetical protein